MIVPVGLEHDAVMQAFQHVAVNKIYLLDEINTADTPSIRKWKDHFFEKAWRPVHDLFGERAIRKEFNINDVEGMVTMLCDIMKKEMKSGSRGRVYINVSCVENIFAAFSFLVAGFFNNVTIFSMEPKGTTCNVLVDWLLSGKNEIIPSEFFKHGMTRGPYTCTLYPNMDTIKPSEFEASILEKVKNNESYLYYGLFDGKVLDRSDKSTAGKVSSCVGRLERMGYVITSGRGKKKLVKITSKGNIVSVIKAAAKS
jgi:hypothetical protein